MRAKVLGGLAALVFGLGLSSPEKAQATDWYHRAPAGYGTIQTVHHWGYYPRYNTVYSVEYTTDPYLYHYEPRGYYPYYNSGYWRPLAEIRARARARPVLVQPPYYAAWGYPVASYSHVVWHKVHHGRIHIGHW